MIRAMLSRRNVARGIRSSRAGESVAKARARSLAMVSFPARSDDTALMRPGDVIAERFELEREAGSGGMSVVFRARDRLTGEPVALKVLRASSEDYERRFA